MSKTKASNAARWPAPGAQLGPFHLKQVVGKGGMGRVYLADRDSEDPSAARVDVALKVLDPELAKRKTVREFFLQEAELGQELSHPNLVAFVDSGEHEGFFYLAFEYIHGLSLDRLLKKEGALARDLALSVIEDVTFGLASAHQKGIVHRDLKPQNIMITPDNLIKVIDFGLADASAGIGEGKTVGTPVYAAPEQNLGKKTNAAADVYSLGLLTYELFSGARLLPGGGLKKVLSQQIKLQKVLDGGVPLNPKIPKEIEPMLRRMLAFKPSERFPSAMSIVPELERFLPRERKAQSDALARTKAEALSELADAHYAKALQASKAGDYEAAAVECQRMVSLRPPNLARLQESIRAEILEVAWQPEVGGPVPEVETPPGPDLEALESLANWAGAAELPLLRAALQARLVRAVQYYAPEDFDALVVRSYDSIPVQLAVFDDTSRTPSDRGRVGERLTWSYFAAGLPERAGEVADRALKMDPGNPSLVVAKQQIDARLAEVAKGKESLVALLRILAAQADPKARLQKAREFAHKHPYLREGVELMVDEGRACGENAAVVEGLVDLGGREMLLREPGYGFRWFVQALSLEPDHQEAQLLLVECLRDAGRDVRLPSGRAERRGGLLRRTGLVGPIVAQLEGALDGSAADLGRLRLLAELAGEDPVRWSLDGILLKLGAAEAEQGEAEAARATFAAALGASRDPQKTLAKLRTLPVVAKIYNRLELARMASDIAS